MDTPHTDTPHPDPRHTGAPLEIEPLGDHDYLVRLGSAPSRVESRFRADPGVLENLGAGPDDERRVVAATADFLAERQDTADLPAMIDLFDVASAYEDFTDELRRRLGDRAAS
jgi:hypothetical protein